MWDGPVLQPPLCHESFPTWLPVSTPPTGLDECFSFNLVVVGLPYISIFLAVLVVFLFFKYVVVLLLIVRGGTVCLPMPPSWLDRTLFYRLKFEFV